MARTIPLAGLAAGLLALLAPISMAPTVAATTEAAGDTTAQEPWAREAPAEIVTAEACGECHTSAYQVWQGTVHETGFRELHRKPQAQEIAAKMGFRLVKRNSLCLRCHYTPVEVPVEAATEDKAELRAIAGVSCESCHGAGRDWIRVHYDYGPGKSFRTETPEHRRERIEASREAGMRRPSDLYAIAASCYACHTVPEEKLVDVGGHTAGSAGFELVAATQGAMRHNFLASSLTGDGKVNRERPPEERRMMYVVGRAVALEYALRAAAEATQPGTYARNAGRRIQAASIELRKIALLEPLPEIDQMLAAARDAPAVPPSGPLSESEHRAAILAAAETVASIARSLPERYEPTQLADLDPLVRGEPLAVPPPEPEPADAIAAAGDGGEGAAASDSAGASTSGTVAEAGTAPAAEAAKADAGRTAAPAVGAVKTHIRPVSDHRTLGQSACSGCHQEQNNWWLGDPHSRSAQPFFDRDPKRLQIARLYGVPTSELTRGNRLCMNCHGTVISGNEPFDVFDGVSCESCHGPSADYLEPHKAGDKALGVRRPGYVDGLRLGMNELRDLSVRARVCSGCHYITDERLISSGHPSGKDFDYVAGMAKTRHWTRPHADTEIAAAFAPALAARGPVPDVPLGVLATAPAAPRREGDRTDVGAGTAAASAAPTAVAEGAAPAPGGDRVPPSSAAAARPIELPPFPEVDESATTDELLILLKERLEQLYEAVEPGSEPPEEHP